MKKYDDVVGIDVSKLTIDAHMYKRSIHQVFSNTSKRKPFRLWNRVSNTPKRKLFRLWNLYLKISKRKPFRLWNRDFVV